MKTLKTLLIIILSISALSCQKDDISYLSEISSVADTKIESQNITPQKIYTTSIQNHEWNRGLFTHSIDFIDFGGTSPVEVGTSFSYFDYDLDGDLDIFAFPESILRGNKSQGGWPPPVLLINEGLTPSRRSIKWKMVENIVPNFNVTRGYRKLTSADLNNDGYLDFVGFNAEDPYAGNGFRIMGGIDTFIFNPEDGTFTYNEVFPYSEGALPYFHGGTLADVNQDGWVDIIGGGVSANIFFNNQGSFNGEYIQVSKYKSSGHSNADIYSIDAIDINKDGYPDLLVGASKKPWSNGYYETFDREDFGKPSEIYFGSPEYPHYKNEPDIVLDLEYDYTDLNENQWLSSTFSANMDWSVIDFDNDGDLDIFTFLIKDYGTTSVILYHENDNGDFIPKTEEVFESGHQFFDMQYSVGGGLSYFKVWDIDGDGIKEILFEITSIDGKNGYKKVNGKYRKVAIPNIYNTN